MSMDTVTLHDLKAHGSKALPEAKVCYLIINSSPKFAILPLREYRALMDAVEELQDIRAIQESRGEATVPWKAVFGQQRSVQYAVTITQAAADQIKRLPQTIVEQLQPLLLKLYSSTSHGVAKKIHGYDHYYRMDFGQHHITYEVNPATHFINVVSVQYTVSR